MVILLAKRDNVDIFHTTKIKLLFIELLLAFWILRRTHINPNTLFVQSLYMRGVPFLTQNIQPQSLTILKKRYLIFFSFNCPGDLMELNEFSFMWNSSLSFATNSIFSVWFPCWEQVHWDLSYSIWRNRRKTNFATGQRETAARKRRAAETAVSTFQAKWPYCVDAL